MAYQYCDGCNTEMEYPSIAEVLVGTRFCPSCGEECSTLLGNEDRLDAINAFINTLQKIRD